jgi:gamma-glutamylcyclotransferase (GGCT)/AIG2-like uncharacterized protein YtfP
MIDPSPRFHLFAYGSLKSPYTGAARTLLAGCERIGEAIIRGTLYDLGEFPALLLDGSDPVPGVLWRCPADRLADLDAYEGVDSGLFRRVAARVSGHACWVYVAGPRLGPRLVPGAKVTLDGLGPEG